MSATAADRLNAALGDRYRIERELGEGGMATVYVAKDLRHNRNVALKVLRPELAAVLGGERFITEIQTTANLQHPHILPLFDSGEADGFLYYVMPYIDGETLRDKLDRDRQLGVDEAVRIARDVADALDYAHRNNVIHRDIKPANILLHDGRPVVADFGIALAVSAAGGGRMTETGLSLGTPHYMSPEQASADRDLSARSDVYSLGCVLYEMIAGQPPHTGPTAQSVLVRILTESPRPLAELRHTVPAHVAAVVTKAIEKLPADRFESAADFMSALADEGFTYQTQPRAAEAVLAPEPTRARVTRGWYRDGRIVAALLVAVVASALAALGWLRPEPEPGVPTRVRLTGFDISRAFGWRLAISPDGRWIVAGGSDALYIRPADDPEWRLLPNTEGGTNPTFSPDGQWVAFGAGGTISKVPITGGPALPIAQGGSPHWGVGDVVVFHTGGRLYRVGAAGGEPELLLDVDSVDVSRPHLLPNARAVVFGTTPDGAPVNARILIYEIETGVVRELVASGNNPRYVPTGHLIYGHGDGALMGVPFDLDRLETTGPPVTLVPELTVFGGGASQFAVSENGTLIYDGGGGNAGAAGRTLVEVDLAGVQSPIPLSAGELEVPRYSPDGTKIAYEDGPEVRVYDVVTGASPVFTTGGGTLPVWSPGGEYLHFSTGGEADGYRRPADGREEASRLFDRDGVNWILGVSAGDSIVVVMEGTDQRGLDLLLMRGAADSAEFEDFLTAEWTESNPDISPDGRWIAYQSDESGEPRIYVHTFPVITGRYSVSPGRGTDPVWSPDGDRLYYRSGSEFYAVDVTTEPTFSVSVPDLLFDEVAFTWQTFGGNVRNWDVHPDGSRFVVVNAGIGSTAAGGNTLADVNLVVNWFEELKQRMGG
jgi:Tol biopolymer transport system component